MPDNFWILCGKPEHWVVGLKDGIWGLIPKFQGKWKYLKQGDLLVFYATSPLSGVIGIGRSQAKFKQNQPLWPDELMEKEVLYPFRFEFQPEYVLPEKEWKSKKIKLALPVGYYSALNLLDDKDIIDKLTENIKQQWNVSFDFEAVVDTYNALPPKSQSLLERSNLSHDKVKDMIFEIGKIHHYMTDKEYVMNSDRLDVVWRRVEKSVPTYAFEIQIGGDIYHALAKLKHAYDLWNSNIYIVIDEKHRSKCEELLSGTFHEITSIVKIINISQINDLYALQIDDVNLRKQLGLP
jgi:predicted RNA-binding protein